MASLTVDWRPVTCRCCGFGPPGPALVNG